MSEAIQSPQELEVALGQRIRALRLRRNLSQSQVAALANVGVKSIYKLEHGRGSMVETMLRVLRALNVMDPIGAIAPAPQVDPLALLHSPNPPQRSS